MLEADDALERTQSDAFPEVYKKSTIEQRRKIVSDRIDAICQADPEMRDKIECAFYHSKVSLGLEDGKVPIRKSIFFCLSNVDALNKTYFGRDISSADAAKILRDHGGTDIFNPLRHDQEYAVRDFKRQIRQTLEDALMNDAPAGYSEIRPAGHGTTPINPDDRAKSIYEAYVLPLFSPSGMRLDADGQWTPSDDNPFKLLAGNVLAAAEKPILNVGTKIADPFVKLFSSETQYNDFRNYVETLGAALDKQRNDSARALGHDPDFQWSNGGNAGDYARQIARAGVFMAPDLLRLAVETQLAGPSGTMIIEGLNAAGETDINLGRQGVDFQKRNTAAAVSALSTMFTFYVMGKAQKFFNPAKRVAGAAGFNSQGFPAIVATDGKEIFARQIGSEVFPEAAGFYKTFFVDLIEKSWLNYAKNVLGETAAVGAASAVSTLAENFANIALGLEKKENLWKGIPEKAVVPMLFAFTSANARYGRAMNAKDFYAGFFRDPQEPYVYRDARASVIKGLLANGGGNPVMTSAVKPISPISTESGGDAIAKLCGFHSPGFLLDVPNRPFIDYMRYSALAAQSDFPVDFLRLDPADQIAQIERWKTADGDNGLERTQTDLNGQKRTITDKDNENDAGQMMQLDGIARAQLYFGDRNGKMAHRAGDVIAAAEACKKDFPQLDLGVFNSAQEFPEDVKKEISAQGFSLNSVRAYYRDGKIYVNAEKVRPAEVGRLVIKHELTTHDGIKRVFDAETRKMVFDAIRRDNAQDLQDFCARTGYDVNSDIAVEEYLAERCELEGNDWRKLYAANQEAIHAFAEGNGTPTGSDEFKRRATYAYFDVHPEELPKVAWYERLYAAFKAALRKLFSGRIAGFTDVDFRKLFRDMWKAVKEDRPYRQGADMEGRALARKDANGNYVQEFGQRNTIVPDNTPLKIVPVSTMQYVSTAGNADEIAAHHLRTDDADNIIKRKIIQTHFFLLGQRA
ncbi:MAG: hypothetical protein MJ016_08150, partial [Victivallaceae bacterium]|nr:hypothetical protein [Victivallaceae bacterium]